MSWRAPTAQETHNKRREAALASLSAGLILSARERAALTDEDVATWRAEWQKKVGR